MQGKITSDMISSIELERSRPTPVLPEWDLGVILEALSPPYEPLWEASLKQLTYDCLPSSYGLHGLNMNSK